MKFSLKCKISFFRMKDLYPNALLIPEEGQKLCHQKKTTKSFTSSKVGVSEMILYYGNRYSLSVESEVTIRNVCTTMYYSGQNVVLNAAN